MSSLAERLAALNLLAVPVWVADPVGPYILWANDAAVRMFDARDAAELCARDFTKVSPAVRARLDHAVAENRAGRVVCTQATLYPKGKPVTATITLTAVTLDDGRQGLLQHATFKDAVDSELIRGIEALRHSPMVVALLDKDGAVLMRNPAAIRAFGEQSPLAQWFVSAADAAAVVGVAGREDLAQVVQARTLAGDRWFSLVAHPQVDPVSGQPSILLHMVDETARREAEQKADAQSRLAAELARALALVEEQHRQILTLSAPVLDVGDGILAVPIIGRLDAERSRELAVRLLTMVGTNRTQDVLLDLTGLDAPDASCARYLGSISQALGLMGARTILSGASPALARVLVESEVELASVSFVRDLRQALERCRARRVGKTAGKESPA